MKVFLSYSHSDKKFATKLANDLKDRKIVPWFDEWEMTPGDSLSDKIQEGIAESFLFLVILSSASLKSGWCNKELGAAEVMEVKKGRKFVIPILYEKCPLPPFMQARLYADFSSNYDNGLKELIKALPVIDYCVVDVPCAHCGEITKQPILRTTDTDMQHKAVDCQKCGTRYFVHVPKGGVEFYTTKDGKNDYGIPPTKGLDFEGAVRWTLKKKQTWVPPNQFEGMLKLMEETEERLINDDITLTTHELQSAMISSNNITLRGVGKQSIRFFLNTLRQRRYFRGENNESVKFYEEYNNLYNRSRVIESYIRCCLNKLKASNVICNTEQSTHVIRYLLNCTEDYANEIAMSISDNT